MSLTTLRAGAWGDEAEQEREGRSVSAAVANGLRQAYLDAIYQVPGCAFVLREAPSGLTLFDGGAFAVITAYNPRSERRSDDENRERHAVLEAEVRSRGWRYALSVSAAPTGEWREEGVVVFDLALHDALELGRQFEQYAVLYGRHGKVALAWCDGGLERFYPHPVNAKGGNP